MEREGDEEERKSCRGGKRGGVVWWSEALGPRGIACRGGLMVVGDGFPARCFIVVSGACLTGKFCPSTSRRFHK